MHHMKKGVERLCRTGRRSRLSLSRNQQFGTTSKSGATTDGSKTGQTIQKSSASTATAAQHVNSKTSGEVPLEARSTVRRIPLDIPFPGVKSVEHGRAEKMTFDTEITTLKNGMRVGSQARYGQYSTIGVSIKSGSRYESGFTKGVSHISEKLGFLSSQNFVSKPAVMKELEQYGAICDAQTSRDTTVYAISTEKHGLPHLMKLLGDIVLRPTITEEELQHARQTALYEMEDMQMRPEQEAIILEMMHSAAWGNNTLGHPRYCPPANAEKITREEILRFMKTNFRPERMVISGVGVEHKELVDLTNEYFNFGQTTWEKEGVHSSPVNDEIAQYTGGDLREQKDFGQFNAGPLPVPKLGHMALGLQSVSHSDPLFIPACVLNILMGGGGSFSAGGPGKGMYSRLYTNVLNNKHWIYNATAYNSSYMDSGLFSIYASAPPEYMGNLTEILIQELHGMVGSPYEFEFERAKKQLQSMLLMNLESRPVAFEDVGRQILAHGHYKSPTEYLTMIENVQEQDMRELAKIMLKSKPTLAALGDISRIPAYEDIINKNSCLREPARRFFRR